MLLAMTLALCVTDSWGADDDIMFPPKNFADMGDAAVGISGTLTGDNVGYKNNNTYAIFCNKERQECLISSIEDIGPGHIGRLDYPYWFPITRWNAYEVVATEETDDWHCSRTTITIVRKSQTALWVQEPINQTRPGCEKSDTKDRQVDD